ncbi:hypothetical protein A3I56_01060 [Candidatus Roizmanbacteria bacterium RIFCSPLOWO2_02_FULL_43_10]|uniref:histidine kinase n=2 Tax=Candidatus Roizmaniibacteriota TaxID=1752723 RepID=A0A1F7JW36_9BACT|nr:MAG: hypothetical protein A3D08_01600 [Candidatus Roizmanbacteria bacterium RIFCSPHIGHO2_02_FULL_43_11]OGK59821.1 MAG: hypothetical protein A3I56_01060 [Candidatus Roizmanbacteria bacterium RIFCSPLOWO2_02_FULL_43_10]
MSNDQEKLQGVLQRINEQMYERNVELTVKNKTLSILRELYAIINTTLGVQETAQRLVYSMTKEMNFRGGSVVLYNARTRTLDVIAASSSREHPPAKNVSILESLLELKLSPRKKENDVVEVFLTGKRKVSNRLHALLTPYVDKQIAELWQTELKIESFVLLPIVFAHKVLGVLILALHKNSDDLSRSEKETLNEVIDVVGIALEQARIYADLKQANKRLKELDKMKDDFVSIASHELRTPMTAIKSYLWMALAGKGGPLREKQKYYLNRSYTSTDRLIKLVNNMLTISRIESGRISLTFSRVNILQLAQEVYEEVKPRADELKLSVKISNHVDDMGSKRKPFVIADKDKVKEVLFNFIGNSFKFTPEGGTITVYFSYENDCITTSVTDTGQGIDVKDLPTLFTKFGMIAGSYVSNKKASGTGLGLYISKSIIDLHGGEIKGTSEGIGKGATFSFSLPLYSANKFKEMNKKSRKGSVDVIHVGVD